MNAISTAVKGYVYAQDGKYDGPYYFQDTNENIASFVMAHKDHATIITDILGKLLVNSLPGGFLDRFGPGYEGRRDGILKAILPMQLRGKEPCKIDYIELPF